MCLFSSNSHNNPYSRRYICSHCVLTFDTRPALETHQHLSHPNLGIHPHHHHSQHPTPAEGSPVPEQEEAHDLSLKGENRTFRDDEDSRNNGNREFTSSPILCPADDCGYSANTTASLASHIRQSHGRSETPCCPHCGYQLTHDELSRDHWLTHHSEVCAACVHVFTAVYGPQLWKKVHVRPGTLESPLDAIVTGLNRKRTAHDSLPTVGLALTVPTIPISLTAGLVTSRGSGMEASGRGGGSAMETSHCGGSSGMEPSSGSGMSSSPTHNATTTDNYNNNAFPTTTTPPPPLLHHHHQRDTSSPDSDQQDTDNERFNKRSRKQSCPKKVVLAVTEEEQEEQEQEQEEEERKGREERREEAHQPLLSSTTSTNNNNNSGCVMGMRKRSSVRVKRKSSQNRSGFTNRQCHKCPRRPVFASRARLQLHIRWNHGGRLGSLRRSNSQRDLTNGV